MFKSKTDSTENIGLFAGASYKQYDETIAWAKVSSAKHVFRLLKTQYQEIINETDDPRSMD